eukprot:5758580-Amphidinium_carterae.1
MGMHIKRGWSPTAHASHCFRTCAQGTNREDPMLAKNCKLTWDRLGGPLVLSNRLQASQIAARLRVSLGRNRHWEAS